MTQELLEHLKECAPRSVEKEGEEPMYAVPMYFFRRPLGWAGDPECRRVTNGRKYATEGEIE